MKHSPAFTIVEMLVVISLTVLLMLTATSLFMAMLIGNTKETVTQKVKAEGEYAAGQMEFLLRNAVAVIPNPLSPANPVCTTGMSSITVRSADNGVTILLKETDPSDGKDKIASNSSQYLTSGAVDITAGPVFDCRQSNDGGKTYVTISFTLRKGTPGVDKPRDIVEQAFTTGVSLRTY